MSGKQSGHQKETNNIINGCLNSAFFKSSTFIIHTTHTLEDSSSDVKQIAEHLQCCNFKEKCRTSVRRKRSKYTTETLLSSKGDIYSLYE